MKVEGSSLVPHTNTWIERDGQVVLSSWRVRLLEAIEETGSISAAAERMQVQYRLAWERLEEMEDGLGVRLVDRHVGGVGGGGASLTATGRDCVIRFRQFAEDLEQGMAARFQEIFEGPEVGDQETEVRDQKTEVRKQAT